MKEREALRLALEALKHTHPSPLTSFYTICDRDKAIKAIEEHLAQPEQEPVAFLTNRRQRLNVEFNATGLTLMPKSVDWKIPLYTTPPQRTWVGLTEEEWEELWRIGCTAADLIDAVEAKLKEKNT